MRSQVHLLRRALVPAGFDGLETVHGVGSRQHGRFNVGMVYVSHHGESLGNYGLHLHGMPRGIAGREQREVKMVL